MFIKLDREFWKRSHLHRKYHFLRWATISSASIRWLPSAKLAHKISIQNNPFFHLWWRVLLFCKFCGPLILNFHCPVYTFKTFYYSLCSVVWCLCMCVCASVLSSSFMFSLQVYIIHSLSTSLLQSSPSPHCPHPIPW